LAPQNYRVCLLNDNSVITSKLYQNLVGALHNNAIKQHIIKSTMGQTSFPLLIGMGIKEHSRDNHVLYGENDPWVVEYKQAK